MESLWFRLPKAIKLSLVFRLTLYATSNLFVGVPEINLSSWQDRIVKVANDIITIIRVELSLGSVIGHIKSIKLILRENKHITSVNNFFSKVEFIQ